MPNTGSASVAALTPVGRGSALISWSGSMFEYLMPALVMRSPIGSMLEHTYRLVVDRQISYAGRATACRGESPSPDSTPVTSPRRYQYSGFGVPGLGIRRGLSDALVIAPYATALAAMIRPDAAVRNFARLTASGAAGRYGFREALDYTARRLPRGASVAIVNSYMAHHQGMVVVALGNVVNNRAMVERFHAEPAVEATELLLQERMPRDSLAARPRPEVTSAADVRDTVPPISRRFTSPHDTVPRTHLLSNGRYAVMVTAAGAGYSRWGDVAVSRWREDVTCDPWGSFVYLRDMDSGAVWSPAHQPTGVDADTYEVTYYEDHAEFTRRDGSIVSGLTVVVSAEDDAEIRRVSLTNLGSRHTRDRADVVPRARPLAAGGGHRSPSVPEPVRADRVRCRHRRPAGDPPSTVRRRTARVGRPRHHGGGADGRIHPVRDRSSSLPRAGPIDPFARLGHRRAPSVEHGRCRVGSDLQPSDQSEDRARRNGPLDLRHGRRRLA